MSHPSTVEYPYLAMLKFLVIASAWVFIPTAAATARFDCTDLNIPPAFEVTYPVSPDGDFYLRDSFPETEVPKRYWHEPIYGSYGPCPMTYPKVIPEQSINRLLWMRERIRKVAEKYVGLPYKPHHIPSLGGLDCSNFTSWIYNFGFGIRFSSNIRRQAEEAGRMLDPAEPMAEGDLLFIYNEAREQIAHVAIYLNERQVIDSSGIGVQIRPFIGRYKTALAWTRRILE